MGFSLASSSQVGETCRKKYERSCNTGPCCKGLYCDPSTNTCMPVPKLKCKTQRDKGPVRNTTCVFPFKYKGKTYKMCTHMDLVGDEPWCATETEGKEHNYVEGKWGYCEFSKCKHCYATTEQICKFPFTYHLKTYYTCTSVDSDRPWCCVIKAAGYRTCGDNWAYCRSDCPNDS